LRFTRNQCPASSRDEQRLTTPISGMAKYQCGRKPHVVTVAYRMIEALPIIVRANLLRTVRNILCTTDQRLAGFGLHP